jgi:pimeloyl-ACP methyl ester carboxylesterase
MHNPNAIRAVKQPAILVILAIVAATGCSSSQTASSSTTQVRVTTTAGPASSTTTAPSSTTSPSTAAPTSTAVPTSTIAPTSTAAPTSTTRVTIAAGVLLDSCLTASDVDRVVTMRTADDIVLRGVEYGTGPNGIVLAHEYRSSLCLWDPISQRLAAEGYHVLAIDQRGYGMSASGPAALSHNDILAAATELRARGATRLVLMGASFGGTNVLTAAPQLEPPADGVVSLSGPAVADKTDALTAIAAIRNPVLLLAGTTDGEFTKDANTLASAAPGVASLHLIPGSRHGVALLTSDDTRTEAVRLVNEFLAARLQNG